MALTDKLSAIGDAIRAKTGKTAGMTLDQMPGEIAGISGGGTLGAISVTENGVYSAAYETASFTWDENTEYDGTAMIDGVPLRYKKVANLCVPDDVKYFNSPEYFINVTMQGNVLQSIPLSNGEIFETNGAYMSDNAGFAVVWFKDATLANAGYGTSFENNAVYITDVVWLDVHAGFAGTSLTLTAPGKKLDGISSVNVDVKHNVGEITITGNGRYAASDRGIDGFSEVVVHVPNAAVCGVWKFNDVVDFSPLDSYFMSGHDNSYRVDVNFACDSIYRGRIPFVSFVFLRSYEIRGMQYREGPNSETVAVVDGYWDTDTGLRTVDFGNDPQIVSAAFKEWLEQNAVWLPDQLSDPVLQEKTATENGEVYPDDGYDGLSKVTVAVENTGSGNVAINGIIKQYKVNAGATVNAGDFVEFVNKCGDGVFHNGSTSGLSACKLDNSRVFVAYTSNANSSYGTAVVLHIDGDTITVGAKKVFNSSATAYCSVAALTDGKVLVAYYHNTSNPRGHARILTIDGTTIASVGSAFAFWDDDVESVSVIALSESKALVAYMYHVYTGSRGGRVTVLNISGTSISSGAEKSFYSASGSISLSGISLTKLTEGSALLRYYLSSKYYVYVLAIDETAISIGSSLSYTYGVYVTALSETAALAVFNDSTSGYFTASILSISGLSISRTNTMLRDGSLSVANVAALSENKALVTFNDGSMMVLSIGGTTVSEAATAVFTDATSRSSINIVPFSAASAFIAFVGDGLGMYASLSIDGDTINAADASGTFVQPATGRLHNVGIAATGGAEGDTVDVYMSGIPRSEIVYDYCCTFSAKETTAGTTLTSSVNCAVGDLVVAAIATRDTLTLSDGWTLISTSDVNSTDTTNGHRLSWAYKFAESTTESITVTQASEQRLYINMVALQGATGVTDNGYSYADDAASTRITVTKPEGLVLWGMTAPLWGSTAWTASNNMPIIQLGSGTQQRLGIGLDQSDETSVTIVPSSATPLTVGCLRVHGMDKFYTASTHTWLE